MSSLSDFVFVLLGHANTCRFPLSLLSPSISLPSLPLCLSLPLFVSLLLSLSLSLLSLTLSPSYLPRSRRDGNATPSHLKAAEVLGGSGAKGICGIAYRGESPVNARRNLRSGEEASPLPLFLHTPSKLKNGQNRKYGEENGVPTWCSYPQSKAQQRSNALCHDLAIV